MNGKSERNNITKNNNLFIQKRRFDENISVASMSRWDSYFVFFFFSSRRFVYFVVWECVISIYCSIQSSKSSEASLFRQKQKLNYHIQCENIKRVGMTMTHKCREVCNKNSIKINISINDGYLRNVIRSVFFFVRIFHEFWMFLLLFAVYQLFWQIEFER